MIIGRNPQSQPEPSESQLQLICSMHGKAVDGLMLGWLQALDMKNHHRHIGEAEESPYFHPRLAAPADMQLRQKNLVPCMKFGKLIT